MSEQVPDEAVEAACEAYWNGRRPLATTQVRDGIKAALEAAAPFIRAQGEREHRASTLRPYREGTPLVTVAESEWNEAEETFAEVPRLEDALANANAYAEGLPSRIADYLVAHGSGGNQSDAWQAGHNYAMREAARLVRERWYDLPDRATAECEGGAS